MRPALTPDPAGTPAFTSRQGATHPTASTTNTTNKGDLMSTTPSAGGILAAADALRGPQQTFNREQVAYLMHLAYDSGRTATHLADVARIHCASEDSGWMRPTYEQRVAEEIAEMSSRAARIHAELGHPPGYEYRGGAVEWETGRPVRHLGAVA